MRQTDCCSAENFAALCERFAHSLRASPLVSEKRQLTILQWVGLFLGQLAEVRDERSAASSRDAAPRPELRLVRSTEEIRS